MKAFIQPLLEMAEFEEIAGRLGKQEGVIYVSGCTDSQKAHLLHGLREYSKHQLIITGDEQKARDFYEDYRFYEPQAMFYPGKDLLFYKTDVQGNLLTRERVKVIRSLLEREGSVVVTSISGCMDFLRPLEKIKKELLHFSKESLVDLPELERQLVYFGYERVAQVEMPGQFSVRGGIIDIYCLTEENPWRMELWGDEIDSIRSFDATSQRSLENLAEITVYPAAEAEQEEGMVSFLEYFSREDTAIFLDEPNRLAETALSIEKEFTESVKNRMQKGDGTLQQEMLCDYSRFCRKISQRSCVALSTIEQTQKEWKTAGKSDLTVQSVSPYNNSFDLLVKDLASWKRRNYKILLLSGSRTRAARLAEDLRDNDLPAVYSENYDREMQSGEIVVVYGHARKGFEYPLLKFVIITESDIFGREKKKKRRKSLYSGQKIQDFSELSVGDYVVHESHGLGIYRGIEKIEVDKIVKDYMKIEYADHGNLYILATQFNTVQKYAGADAKKPKLNRLGGKEWGRTKTRVRGAVKNIARELVQLYAARQEGQGYAYEEDTVWQREFEEMFPYEETEDQLQAIEDTKKDMESSKIMDRLICGDVGYGKTEIAIRAAFKAVQENKQVAYLVPTTILAQQHYNTFIQRMKDFPVRVDLLCRFRNSKEQKKTIQDLRKGLVDIVIGTHRILSQDVKFKDLGLLIVDEEQRFGVTHKEKIKKMKENVDVLTLTATPIPRTLHMSLIGIRDMSVLEEPPIDRMPVQTYVMEYDEEAVREAIVRELKRDGQVYYVYNRVKDIADVAGKISRLIPEAEVAYAHGQMSERQLEKIMYDFINGDIDVLVSTTIVETGLDISNANTMIIHDADRYGLSQLYQLRGRIGRSNRMAYAFLMYRRDKLLQETAQKRLSAIREFTQLGSGFKIAMRDLEIRGAGNLLGAEQHGHMEAVGYDLYCKMLSEAVREEKGIAPEADFTTTIEMDADAYIPPRYISNEMQKLDIYRKIAGIECREDYEDILEELFDRFGEPPKAVMNLLVIARMKALAHSVYVTEVKQQGKTVKITFYPAAKIHASGFPELLKEYNRRLDFKAYVTPHFSLQAEKKALEEVEKFLEKLLPLVYE